MRGLSAGVGASLVALLSVLVGCATGGSGVGDYGLGSGDDAGQASRGPDSGASSGSGGSSGGASSSSSSGGTSSSSGGNGSSSSGAPGDDGSAGGNDSGAGDDGGGSSGGSGSGGGSGSSSGSAGNFCGSNPLYYVEALAAYTGGSGQPCASNADCPSAQCCFQAIKNLPIDVCIMQ